MTGKTAAPMPERISPWGIYDVFKVKNGEQFFWPWWATAVEDFCEVPLALPTCFRR